MVKSQEESSKEFEDYRSKNASIQNSLGKLNLHFQREEALSKGLSSQFQQELGDIEKELQESCKAMDRIAKEYVPQLERFKESENFYDILDALDKSEEIWRSESPAIIKFDKTGSEKEFILNMRVKALQVFELKLVEACDRFRGDSSMENKMVCLAIIAVMDHAMGDLGYPESCKERQRFADIAKMFGS